jgi:hypothetical protein
MANNRAALPYFLKDNANFAGILIKNIHVIGKTELLKEAKAKYDAYNSEDWTKIYFDKFSGGFNVYHKEHKFSANGGGGDAEKTVGEMLAKYNGKQVEFLPESGYQKSPDIKFDGKTWDIKYIEHANEETMRTYIKDSRKANSAIFYWNKGDKLELLEMAIQRSIGYFTSKNKLNTMPDIYCMDKSGWLKLLWEK